jgi:hypothetical protein
VGKAEPLDLKVPQAPLVSETIEQLPAQCLQRQPDPGLRRLPTGLELRQNQIQVDARVEPAVAHLTDDEPGSVPALDWLILQIANMAISGEAPMRLL